MTALQEALILIGVPVGVTVVVYALIYMRSPRKQQSYRPGRPYNYPPVWFVARPEGVSIAAAAELTSATEPPQLESAGSVEKSSRDVSPSPKGGAHGSW
ncbi:hypothetical protein [Natronoglycomyces albus]|uniref:Uncharacterized protein n=1 Tax=Natronoglycomyces albus TaxID=2811108 RepID=A0A895XKL0_9ACTN|nr:hypothetical protein [Natronoglycomyces albus]QSB06271.1 hypothetical protein JQS30_05015 [Natronoglycomyces albus]